MADRIQRMKADANDLAVKIFEQFSDGIRDLQLEDSSLRFEIKDDGSWREVSICFNDDYPDSTIIWGLEDTNPGRMTAEEAFMVVAKKCNLCSNGDEIGASGDTSSNSQEEYGCSTIPKKSRYNFVGEATDDEYRDSKARRDLDDEYETDEEIYQDSDVEINAALKNDIDECRRCLRNDDACTLIHRSSSLESCEIRLNIPLEGVDESLAKGWGMDPHQPVRILLMDVSAVHYRVTHMKPEVSVYQGSMTDKPGVCLKQLQRIIQKYVNESWVKTDDALQAKECILLNLYIYARERLPTLCDFCVICDAKHELASMFMPSVCSRDLCIFSYETLGVMADLDVRFSSQMEVMDLLLKMLAAAVSSSRRDLILMPYPSVPDPNKKGAMAISESTKDYDKLIGLTKKMPCMRTLRELSENGQCLEGLRKLDPLLFPLIRWTFASNRAYLMKLPDADRLPFLNTGHQYLMMLDSPAKEAAFRDAKEKHGESVFAFHGSPFENWHSILRRGLLNASGTPLQMVGAAHGKGIYLSPFLNVSVGYAISRSAIIGDWTRCKTIAAHDCTETGRFLPSQGVFACVALCEVVPTNELRKANHQIWVLSNPNLVCTRFFLVYEQGYVTDQGVDCTKPEMLAKIREAVQKFRNLTSGK